MNKGKSTKCILFLFEGDTEDEFYPKIFRLKGISHKIIGKNLGGIGVNAAKTVIPAKIDDFLSEKCYQDYKQIHVVVALDREGKRHEKDSPINTSLILNRFK